MLSASRTAAPARAARSGLAVAGDMLVVLSLLPLLAAAASSFLPADGASRWAAVWGTSRGYAALAVTLRLAALAASIAIAMAWMLARWAQRLSRPQAMLAACLACMTMLLPSSLLATAWIVACGRQGVITSLLGAHWNIYSVSGAAIVLATRYFGVACLIFVHHFLRQQSTWPAERIFRVDTPALAWRLHFRAALRPMLAAWLIVLLLSMNDHIIPDMLLVPTYGTQVLVMYSAMMDPSAAAALASPLTGIGGLVIVAAAVLLKPSWTVESSDQPAATCRPLGRLAAVAVVAAVLSVALAIPTAVLAWRTASWQAVVAALQDAAPQARQTAVLATIAGLACAAVAAIIAACWVRAGRAGRWSLAPLVLLNLAAPPSLLGIGMVTMANHWPMSIVRDTCWPVVLAYVARFLPVMTLVLYMAWRDESPAAAQAGRIFGLGRWRILRHIHWPAQRRLLLCAALLGTILAATELDVSILLVPPGQATLGVRLATMIHTASDSAVSALAVGVVGLVAPAIVLLLLGGAALSWRKGRS